MKIHFIAIRNAAIDTTRIIAACSAFRIYNGIVVLAAFHTCCSKAASKLNAFYSRNGKHGMADYRFDRVEKRLTEASGKAGNKTAYNAANTILVIDGLLYGCFYICIAACFCEAGLYMNTV